MQGTPSRGRDWAHRRALIPGLLCVLAAVDGCGSLGADSVAGSALIRFVEVSPGSPEMDFYVNGTGAAYGLGFESFTSYLPVAPGTSTMSVRQAGRTQAVVSSQAAFAGGHQYTVVLRHGLGNLQEEVFEDQPTPAPAGETAVRVLNAVEGSPLVTVHFVPEHGSAKPQATALTMASGAESAYVRLVAGVTYQVATVAPGTAVAPPLSTMTIKAETGAVRTLVLAGVVNGPGHTHVVGFLLNDADPL